MVTTEILLTFQVENAELCFMCSFYCKLKILVCKTHSFPSFAFDQGTQEVKVLCFGQLI